MDAQAYPPIRDNPDFHSLLRERSGFAWMLTTLMLVIYFGFIFLVAFAPETMGTPVFGVITLCFPLGLLVILSAIVLTGIYVGRANSRFDALTNRIVASTSR